MLDIPVQKYREITVTAPEDRNPCALWNVSARGEDGTTYNIPCLGEEPVKIAVRAFERVQRNKTLANAHLLC